MASPNKDSGRLAKMTSLNEDNLVNSQFINYQRIRTLGSLEGIGQHNNNNNNQQISSLEILPYAKTQHLLASISSPTNKNSNQCEQQIQPTVQPISVHAATSSQQNSSPDTDSFSQPMNQFSTPFQSKPSMDDKWNPLGWVKESLLKPISSHKTDAKIQYFISSTNEPKIKHRLLSPQTQESGAFSELITFIDKVDKHEDMQLHKLIRKHSCCCGECGVRSKKQIKVDRLLPQFKPKQIIRKMHRNNFQKIITEVNKISQFFRSKLQLNTQYGSSFLGDRNKLNSQLRTQQQTQQSPTLKLKASPQPQRKQSFGHEGGLSQNESAQQQISLKPVKVESTITQGNHRKDYKNHFTSIRPREQFQHQTVVSHKYHSNLSLQLNPETAQTLTISKPEIKTLNMSPEMIRSQKSNKSRFISQNLPSISSQCSTDSQKEQQPKESYQKSKLETAIIRQFKEETKMQHINTEFVMSVGHNILKESLQKLPKDKDTTDDEESLIFQDIPLTHTESVAQNIKDNSIMPQIPPTAIISSFKDSQAKNISNYCRGNAQKLKTILLRPLIITKYEDKLTLKNQTPHELLPQHVHAQSDLSFNHNLKSSLNSQNNEEFIIKNINKHNPNKKHNQSMPSILHNGTNGSFSLMHASPNKYLSNQPSQTSFLRFSSPTKTRQGKMTSFHTAKTTNSGNEELSNKMRNKRQQNTPILTSCSMIDNIYLRNTQPSQHSMSLPRKSIKDDDRPVFTTLGIKTEVIPNIFTSHPKPNKPENMIPIPKQLSKDLSLSYFMQTTQNNNSSNDNKSESNKVLQIPKMQRQSLASQFREVYFSKNNLFQRKSVCQTALSNSSVLFPHK